MCRSDPRFSIPERSLLTFDGEIAQITAFFTPQVLEQSTAQATEVLVGAANATRTQNPADAGGVFFSAKTRVRSGLYNKKIDDTHVCDSIRVGIST